MPKSFITAALAFAAMPLAAQQPAPRPDASTRHVTVRTADLDLRSEPGRTVLDGRLRAAVRHVCPAPDWRDLRMRRGYDACRKAAVEGATARRDHVLAAAGAGGARTVAAR